MMSVAAVNDVEAGIRHRVHDPGNRLRVVAAKRVRNRNRRDATFERSEGRGIVKYQWYIERISLFTSRAFIMLI
jgi:hypothetical protein